MRFLMMLVFLMVPALAQAQIVVGYSVPSVRVNVAPPPARVEVQGVRPSPNHVWIGGHWAWRGNQHVWQTGHWTLPPGGGYQWEAARWENRDGGWHFTEGHWRVPPPAPTAAYYEPAPQGEMVANVEPPAPIVEVQGAPPFGGAVWLPGYWHWNGNRHMWVGGRWSAPRAGYSWEPNHWVRGPGGWRMEHGHWRR